MHINHEIVKALNPCENRYNNFVQHYPNFDNTASKFLELENISYSDKVWVLTRLMTREQNIKWSIMCAESTLYLFEAACPNDGRPRAAIEAAKAYLQAPSESAAESVRSAARSAESAAWSTTKPAARYAAKSAESAAARYATWSAAAESAANAAAWSAARSTESAAWSANSDAGLAVGFAVKSAEKEQENKNLSFLMTILEVSK